MATDGARATYAVDSRPCQREGQEASDLASAPGLYAACAALSAACSATRKGLVSTVRACVIYPEECLGFGYFSNLSVSRYVDCGNGKLFWFCY